MNALEFIYRVHASVELTAVEVAMLMELSRSHYDARCRDASALGGFIYGWYQRVSSTDGSITASVSTDQMDTVCKILEIERGQPSSLASEFRSLFQQMIDESRRVNDYGAVPE